MTSTKFGFIHCLNDSLIFFQLSLKLSLSGKGDERGTEEGKKEEILHKGIKKKCHSPHTESFFQILNGSGEFINFGSLEIIVR
jgi:hypothetical protein